MAAVKFLALIIFGLRGLISSSKLQMNTRFTDATVLCPTLLGFLIKPTCVPLGLEALLSAVLRNRSAILDSTSQSSRPRTKALKLFVYCMLLLSGDISLNPGPSGSLNCGICNKSVRANQKGIQCDSCDLWLHTSCCSIDDSTYYHLANSSCTWICPHCDQPSFSCSSVFSSPSVSLDSEIRFWLCHVTSVTINNWIFLLYHQVLQAKPHLTIVATVPHYAAWRLTVTVSGVLNDLLFLLATLRTLTLI